MPRLHLFLFVCLAVLLSSTGCQSGWGDPLPVDDDDDSTFPTGDDDDATGDDDDATGDDDDATGDDDDATGDDDDATGDDDDATANPNDGDGDGYEGPFGSGEDCNDLDPAINPGAIEDPTNSIDDDCDLVVDEAGSIDTVDPADGIEAGGTLITVTGEGFLAVTSVELGGASVSPGGNSDTEMTLVAPGGSVGDIDLVVTTSFEVLTETNAFTYTGTASTLDGAELIGPATATGALNVALGPFTGSVSESGVTGTGSAPTGIIAEVGYGTQGQLPTTWPDFFWSDATWTHSDVNDDVFSASVTPHTYGTWMVAFRFSDDGGYNWLYADTDSATPLTAIELAMASVTP